ncbi:unnamed protein product [Effrenium voratum]|nr:unnamed protein product [Effrenium voratum]
MPQERLSSLGETTLGPEWLQRGSRPKSESDKLAETYRYARDQLLLLQSSMQLPAAPRQSNGRPVPTAELQPVPKYPVFGAMTKENLVSEGVLPASSLEDKAVAGTLRGRGNEGRGRVGKGQGRKGRGDEDPDLQIEAASPAQDFTSPALGPTSPAPLELPEAPGTPGEVEEGTGKNPMNSFLARVLKNKQNEAAAAAAAEPPPVLPPAVALESVPEFPRSVPEFQAPLVSPVSRPPVPMERPPPPPGGGIEELREGLADGWLDRPERELRPGPLPATSPPRHPLGPLSPLLSAEPFPEPLLSPQRASVNLANALAREFTGPDPVVAPPSAPMSAMTAMSAPGNAPQALQPGRVTAPPPKQQAPMREEPLPMTKPAAVVRAEEEEIFQKERCWYYKDPSQRIQGPFTTSQMQHWQQVGYFKPELPIRRGGTSSAGSGVLPRPPERLERLSAITRRAGESWEPAPSKKHMRTGLVACGLKPWTDSLLPCAVQSGRSTVRLRFRESGNFYRLDLLYPEAPFSQLPAIPDRGPVVDPRAQAAAQAAQAAAVQQAHAAAQAQAQAQALQAAAMARQRQLLADPTGGIQPGGYDYNYAMRLQAQAQAAQAQAAQFAKSLMGMPSFGGYDERRWAEELKAAQALGTSPGYPAERQRRLQEQRVEQQRLELQRQEQRRIEEQRLRQQLERVAPQTMPAVGPPSGPTTLPAPAPLVPPVPAPTMPAAEVSKEGGKKAQPKKQKGPESPGGAPLAPAPVGPKAKEAPPLKSALHFPTLGGAPEEVVMMAPAESSGFWERPLRPVPIKVPNEKEAKQEPKAKAQAKATQKKEDDKGETRRQAKELLTEHGISVEEPIVNFLLSLSTSAEVLDYLQAYHETEGETARRFSEAFVAKGLHTEKPKESKEASSKRKHRVKGKEVDPSMLGFTAVPRGHYES